MTACFLMRRAWFIIVVVFLSLPAEASAKLRVAASFYPLAHFAEQVGGGHVAVENIMPPGAEPHEYEPTPRDIKEIWQSNVFLYHGGGLEPWAEKVGVQVSAEGVLTLRMTDHFNLVPAGEGSDRLDPHIWLDPLLAWKEAEAIRDVFIRADHAREEAYTKNCTAFTDALYVLHRNYEIGLASCKRREFVVTHDAFGYLARRYGLTAYAVSGLSPEEEPSARKLAGLARLAREKEIRYIFFEVLASPRLAETIAREVGAGTLVLNPLGGLTKEEMEAGKTYISVMEENLRNLRLALECE
jgi:zinc transport system substrate-binding protein